jgi:hypothetical protein
MSRDSVCTCVTPPVMSRGFGHAERQFCTRSVHRCGRDRAALNRKVDARRVKAKLVPAPLVDGHLEALRRRARKCRFLAQADESGGAQLRPIPLGIPLWRKWLALRIHTRILPDPASAEKRRSAVMCAQSRRPDYDRGGCSPVRDLRVRSLHRCRARPEPAVHRPDLRRCSEPHRVRLRRRCLLATWSPSSRDILGGRRPVLARPREADDA